MPVLIIDSMNFALAEGMLKKRDIIVIPAERSKVPVIKEILDKKKVKKAGYDADNVPVAIYKILCQAIPGVRWLSENRGMQVSSVLREMREIKTEKEISLISRAARETVDIWREIKRKVKPGMTELEIAALVDGTVHLRGYKNSFTTIAATGVNSAFPHAIPSRCKLKPDDHLLVDFGIVYKGYCSDLTRTLYKGRIDRQITQFRDLVLKAQKLAIDMIAPGVKINRVIKEVNKFFINNKVDQYVLHGLGHGVGIEVHEAPFFRADTVKIFKKGMIVTVEPGLYRKGLGGIRHEDMILLTEKGSKVLTK
jgi:Xaa-Pro aminopeptidase